MKSLFTALILAALPLPVFADAYIMGAGRWTCAKAITVFESGTATEKGELAGWILGYWSFATTTREKGFIDTIERVGGLKIANATIEKCRKAPADLMLFKLADGMIANTR